MPITKVGLFDFEMTNLSAAFGYILCGVLQTDGGELHILRVDDGSKERVPWDDRALAVRLRDVLEQHDILISYNGREDRGFDIPFLNTRLLYYDERPLKKIMHIDLLSYTRKYLRLPSFRLAMVAPHLGLGEKMSIGGHYWVRAAAGDKAALDVIVTRCMSDVEILAGVYAKLKPFVREIR